MARHCVVYHVFIGKSNYMYISIAFIFYSLAIFLMKYLLKYIIIHDRFKKELTIIITQPKIAFMDYNIYT